jgi:hypothetical protein
LVVFLSWVMHRCLKRYVNYLRNIIQQQHTTENDTSLVATGFTYV